MRRWTLGVAVAGTLVLAGCGGGGGDNPPTGGAQQFGTIPVPQVAAGTNFSFDLGTVDPSTGRYYFTDRNNKSIDVVDTSTDKLVAQFKPGYAGVGVDNAHSGPNGIDIVGPNLYTGDVNSVKVIDKTTGALVKNIVVNTTGFRADEGCFDADDNIYMIATPDDSPPFATFINTVSQTVIARVNFTDSAGLEACAYDHGTLSFYVNNDGTTANPHGEVNVIPAASIKALTPGTTTTSTALAGLKVFPEGNCDPAGLVMGPGTDMAVSCRPTIAGTPENMLIMNRTNGAIVATINMGGGDQLWYDPATNRYYSGAARWTSNGITPGNNGACSASAPCTPVLGIVDAASRTVVGRLPSGNNAHSVAVDPVNHKAYLPFSSATSPAGCATCATDFPNGGITIYKTQ
jgi:hypothetical protein